MLLPSPILTLLITVFRILVTHTKMIKIDVTSLGHLELTEIAGFADFSLLTLTRLKKKTLKM